MGVIIGVSIYWASSRAINFYKDQILSGIAWILNIGGGSIDISWLDVTRIERLVFAVVIILILYLRPQGILPEKPIETPGYRYVASIFREGAVRGKYVDKDSGEG